MKIKMPQKFNPDEYKSLEELFPEGKSYLFPVLLDPRRPVFQLKKNNIIIPGKKNGPNLESVIKVGNGDQEKDIGEKVKITGFVRYKGMIEDGSLKYQFNLLPNVDSTNDYVRCFVTKRDKIRSIMLSQEIGSNSINIEKYNELKKTNSTNTTKSKINPQNHNSVTIYGTVQEEGGIYIEIDAANIGKNPIVYHRKKEKIGIQFK